MGSRAFQRPVVILLMACLLAQGGLVGVVRPAPVTYDRYPAPISEDADPVDDVAGEEGDDRGNEAKGGESAFGVQASPSSRRGVPELWHVRTGLTHSAARALRLNPRAGHFLAVGRELRFWLQSPLC